MTCQRHGGFTLIEVLLVIAILAILASIVIIAINPAKQLGEAQNVERRSDVKTILDAINQYSIDNNGALPSGIIVGTSCVNDGDEICRPDATCGGTSLDVLVSGDKYLTDIPTDPVEVTTTGTGYAIIQNSNGRIEVCAPTTYGSVSISAKR